MDITHRLASMTIGDTTHIQREVMPAAPPVNATLTYDDFEPGADITFVLKGLGCGQTALETVAGQTIGFDCDTVRFKLHGCRVTKWDDGEYEIVGRAE